MLDKIIKQYTAKVNIDDDEKTITAIINTDIIDRDGEVVRPSGGDFASYLKNPVVQWAHNYGGPPIGKSLWIKKGRKRITAKTKFADTEFANEIYQLFKGGFLTAFSIGFAPLESHAPTPEEIKKRPELADARRIIEKWELLEFSAVPVPANPEALAFAIKSKSLALTNDLRDALGVEIEEIFYPEGGSKKESDIESAKIASIDVSIINQMPVKLIQKQPVAIHYDEQAIINDVMKKKLGRIN